MANRKTQNLVIGIYFHPEAYPPTLNAVSELSDCFEKITIVHRNHLTGNWKYPANVKTVASGSLISSKGQESSPLWRKFQFFFQFVASLLAACRRDKPLVILVYDNLSLYAYHLIRPLLSRHKIWYHNHDVTETPVRKFSITWFATRSELRAFEYLDIFSLPTDERLRYFPTEVFKGKYFFIPNYPSKKFYSPFYRPKTAGEPLRIIFQGSIGPYHGIEEIIPLLKEQISGYSLQLVLKGPCSDEYRDSCIELAKKNGVLDKLIFNGVTPYAQVPEVSASCHIGIGILAKQDIMNSTLGTASNKIYEYAAVGLPVIYFNRENFTRHLGKYQWALPVELDSVYIKEKIASIISSYEQLSVAAHQDFLKELNFEQGFTNVKSCIKDLMTNSRKRS